MEKPIAMLLVYVSDDATKPSALEWDERKPGIFELGIRPNADIAVAKAAKIKADKQFTQTVVAHELGHFVASITDGVQGSQSDFMRAIGLYNPQLDVPAEQLAWDIAHKMGLKLNPKVEQFAMNTYKTGKPVSL